MEPSSSFRLTQIVEKSYVGLDTLYDQKSLSGMRLVVDPTVITKQYGNGKMNPQWMT